MSNFPENYCLTIFTDASFCNKTNAAGAAYWIRNSNKVVKDSHHVEGAKDNNEAELRAIYLAIERSRKLGFLREENLRVVVIRSDSMIAMQALERKGPLAKSPYADEILETLNHVRIKTTHIKGHSGRRTSQSRLNGWCDKLAKLRMREVRELIS